MTKEQFNKIYAQEQIVILCSTKEEAIGLLKLAESVGYKWSNGELLINNDQWDVYEDSTCYDFNEKCKHVQYSSSEYCMHNDFTVVLFNQNNNVLLLLSL